MKIMIRSREPASSCSPAVENRIKARYSPRREGVRCIVSVETSTAAIAAPASRIWKKIANLSTTRTPPNPCEPTCPSVSSTAE